jgi:hypothetical protein
MISARYVSVPACAVVGAKRPMVAVRAVQAARLNDFTDIRIVPILFGFYFCTGKVVRNFNVQIKVLY